MKSFSLIFKIWSIFYLKRSCLCFPMYWVPPAGYLCNCRTPKALDFRLYEGWNLFVSTNSLAKFHIYFKRKPLLLSLSSKLSCWSNRGSISWGTIRRLWRRPDCLWPSQAIGPCPGHNRPQPQRPFPLWSRNQQPNHALPPVSHWIRYHCHGITN